MDIFGDKERKLKSEVSEAYGEADDAYVMLANAIRDITKIVLTADGWCSNCVQNLIQQMVIRFPEHQKVIEDIHNHMDDYHRANRSKWDLWLKDTNAPEPNIWDTEL